MLKKTLKAVTLAAGLALLAAPVSSFAAGTTAVQHHNQWVKKGSYWTYYNANGALHKGWLKQNSKWYYLDANGNMKTGWALVSGKWYYFEPSGTMKTGWAKVGNQWYYLDSSGAMKTGWLDLGVAWYYLNPSGAMKTGWLKDKEKWYFLDRTSGKMIQDWKAVDGKMYFFYESGHMAANKTIGGKKIGADGAVYEDHTEEVLKNIEQLATEAGLTMEYNSDLGSYWINNGEQNVGSISLDHGVAGEIAYVELWKKVALELGVPRTEAELNDLVEQARQEGSIQTGDLQVHVSERFVMIVWNLE